MVPPLLSPIDVLQKGLECCTGSRYNKCSEATRNKQFHALYGSSPFHLASLWFDLTNTEVEGAKLTAEENTSTGLVMFLMANYFLWSYPKNSRLLASQFGICERYSRGEPIWRWVSKIAAMKETTIVWDPRLDSPNSELFIITVDGTDFRVHEKKHPTLPIDRTQFSKKFNHGALKYEIAMSVFKPKCVWISGPHRGGKHDIVIFREGLKGKIAQGKRVIADRGYVTSRDDEKMLSTPDALDSKELNNFKSRARLRHETFNGRLKFFHCLSDTFRHDLDKHKLAFEAVCVIVQYQMDNGSVIYDA
jgi:DDE superfamily endonuclease